MSEWITDRRPTEQDADRYGYVWTTLNSGDVCPESWCSVPEGAPWMPTNMPEPYVKPKRYCAVWEAELGHWSIIDKYNGRALFLIWLSDRDKHGEAAERIAAIYEEVMP